MTYDLKKAVVDLGFINGYFYANGPSQLMMQSLDRVESLTLFGFDENNDRNLPVSFLHELGCIRGIAWAMPIPAELSLALQRVIDFFTAYPELPCDIFSPKAGEPVHELLSDDSRDAILTKAMDGEDTFSDDFADKIGVTRAGIERFWKCQGVEIEDFEWKGKSDAQAVPDFDKTASTGQAPESDACKPEPLDPVTNSSEIIAEASPEIDMPESQTYCPIESPSADGVTAVAPSKSKGNPPKIQANDLPSVRARFEAGESMQAIGNSYDCSGQTVVNFLRRHGVDTIRQKDRSEAKSGGRPPLTREQVGTIVNEKAKGTPSKAIGEMIDRSQHAVDVKYSELKKAGKVEAFAPIEDSAGDDAAPAVIESPRGKWNAAPIEPEEWPDIQKMLATGRSREQIASDYDVPVHTLNDFIEVRLREAKDRLAAKEAVTALGKR